jgi:thiol-disulfide isomerase/thioredoxin
MLPSWPPSFQTGSGSIQLMNGDARKSLLSTVLLLAPLYIALAAPACVAQETAPALELKDYRGMVRKLGDYAGKIVVLNFWATWCGPCVKEMPIFVELSNKYGEQGVVVLAASLDAAETQPNIPAFVEKQKMPFPVLTGTTVDHMKEFGMGESLPGTIIIDQQGRVVSRILGEARKKEVVERVEWLLGLRKGKKPPKALVKHL